MQENQDPQVRGEASTIAPSGAQATTLLKVAAKSRPSAIAGAIAGVIRGGGVAMVQAVGAASVNQAVKAIAIAQSYLQGDQISIVCIPSFLEVSIDDQERTAMCLQVEPR
ncbi:MAG TPA: stage V sporulation protein S [Chloroflexaceae bacterium]|nr:stage V sporulation protein S [Chloroflexaceae bacterium]